MQKGGIHINNSSQYDAFINFITNSSVKILLSGTYGITLIATLNKNANSDYTHINIGNYGKKVNKLLVKLCFLQKTGAPPVFINIDQNQTMSSIDEKTFIHEVNTQVGIYNKTVEYLMPFCPSIVFADITKTKEDALNILKKFPELLKIKQDKTFFEKLISFFENSQMEGLGVIAMEFMNNYKMASDYEELNNPHIIAPSLYIIIKTAVDTKISHADFHLSNVMINLKDHTFFGNEPIDGEKIGRPLLIDFGMSIELDDDTHRAICDMFEKKKYNEILNILCGYGRYDGLDFQNASMIYDWACKVYDPATLNILNQLDDAYGNAIENLIVKYDKLNKSNPKKFPTLPLNESNFKLNLFTSYLSSVYDNMGASASSSAIQNSTPYLSASEHILTPYSYPSLAYAPTGYTPTHIPLTYQYSPIDFHTHVGGGGRYLYKNTNSKNKKAITQKNREKRYRGNLYRQKSMKK